ncbi:MAG: hypothetical protein ACYDHH_12410 [Solirubrobacteraceae bacterium]
MFEPNPNRLGSSDASVTADDARLLREAATQVFEAANDFAPMFTREVLRQVPQLGSVEDPVAFEATRKSCLANVLEFLCLSRAGLSDPRTIETPPEALEHTRFLNGRGVGMGIVLRFWNIGVSMFEPLMANELSRVVSDPATLQRLAGPLRGYIFTYVDQVTSRQAAELGSAREGWVSDPNHPIWHDPEAVAAVQAFIDERAARGGAVSSDGAAARAYTEAALDRFTVAMRAAASDERLSEVLARAKTTVWIQLADEPDLGVTLLLDRNPVEIVDGHTDTEVEISIVSADLDRLYSPDFHLAMAIARGRVRYSGFVRKFLQITPVVRHASLPQLISAEPAISR